METAYKLFYTQGYNATGINQILVESNVAKASLYQHFGSKEELGVGYIKLVRKEWFLTFENFLSSKSLPNQKILAAFDFLEKNVLLNNFKGCRFLNLFADIDTSSESMQQQIVEHKTKLRTVFKDFVRQHATASGLRLPQAADTIYLLFEAAIVETKLYRDVWPIRAAKNAVASILQINV